MASVWINGSFVPAEAAVDAADRGLLLGDGVFDTALVIAGRVFRRADHLERLMAALAEIAIPAERAVIADAVDALANQQPNGSIRVTVTRGPGPRGLGFPGAPRPTVLGSAAPLVPAAMFAPVRLAWTGIRRNDTSPASRIKSLNYLDAVLASNAARAAGAGEALFLNTRGLLACSSLANVFVLRGDRLLTPPVSDGVLPGIMRRWVLDQASRFGLEAGERSLAPADLEGAALYLSNSLRLLAPAVLEDREPAPPPSPVEALMAGFCEAIARECGTDPRDLGAVGDRGR